MELIRDCLKDEIYSHRELLAGYKAMAMQTLTFYIQAGIKLRFLGQRVA